MSSRLPRRALLAAGLLASTAVLATALPAQALTGGSPVSQGRYGFTAKLNIGDSKGCTGVLIDPQYLLTASTCFALAGEGHHIPGGAPRQPSTAVINRADIAGNEGVQVAITHLIPRADRNAVLAKLASPVTGVPLPKISVAAPRAGETLVATGYGRTGTEWAPQKLQATQFTVGEPAATTFPVTGAADATTCRGDSGGPAFRERDGVTELVALHNTSWQFGCLESTETRKGTVETRVDDLGPWLYAELKHRAAGCAKPVDVFAVRGNGDLYLYQHSGALNGDFAWVDGGGKKIGQGWLGARTVAGPDGVVYAAVENGQLRRFRWNGTDWDTFGGAQYLHIDNGWERYATPQYRNRITVDTRGHIYTIEPDGKLHWRNWDPATKQWSHRVLTGDFAGYDLIVGAGEGVLYARKTTGELFRFSYNSDTGAWVEQGKPSGAGWQMFGTVFSGGADTLYGPATTSDGPELLWYRYQPYSGDWVDTGRGIGKQVGTGWNTEFNLTAAPDACRLAR